MNLSDAKSLLDDLERKPGRIELFTADLEAFILWTMDAVYELAKRGLPWLAPMTALKGRAVCFARLHVGGRITLCA